MSSGIFNAAVYKDRPNDAMSLSELNLRVRETLNGAFPGCYWVRAETSDVRLNASSGHCYLEFIEKDERSGQILAKSRGTIWARTCRILIPYFEQETGQVFRSGLKVLVHVSVVFHEVYGYSLYVQDIEPSYTVGDLVRKRKEIVRKLQEDGIFELNKELAFPSLPRCIAVITSPTAAGYEDFTDQLLHNQQGFPFYTKLFPAVMQGEKTEESVIAALERIFSYADLFDVVVIIRGGGSTSELSSFDSYPLAANCAQFPLPILTGIGHERDDTVVDMVAHTRMKTPTAVASFLIERMSREAGQVHELELNISAGATTRIAGERTVMQRLAARLPAAAGSLVEKRRNRLQAMTACLPVLPQWIRRRADKLDEVVLPRIRRAVDAALSKRVLVTEGMPMRLRSVFAAFMTSHRRKVELREQYIRMASPDYILKRGYTLTLKEGRIIKRADGLATDDEITVKFADGEKKATVR
jgi:exodeoxyribonuclease VII large subunit